MERVFDIPVRDVPRRARLCLAIYAVYSNKKTKKKTGKLEAKGVSGKVPSGGSSPGFYTNGGIYPLVATFLPVYMYNV